MKRILIILAIIALIFAGCAKNASPTSTKQTPDSSKESSQQKETLPSEIEKEEQKAKQEEEKPAEKEKNLPPMENLEDMIEEFNSTENDDRKEELRLQLEAIFNQAEGEVITAQ